MLLPPARRRSLADWKIVAAFLAGTTGGALLTAALAWIVSGFGSRVPPDARIAALAAAALVVGMARVGPLAYRIPLPENRRQIPVEVFNGGLARGALRFGFELGTGARTYVPTPAPYILLLVLLLAWLPLGLAVLVALGFGFGRALPLMIPLSGIDRHKVSEVFLRREGRLAPLAEALVVLVGGIYLV